MSFFRLDKARQVKSAIIGSLISIAIIAVLICAVSLVMLFVDALPYELTPYILLAADALGIFAGAYISAVISGSRGLLTGAMCGAMVFLILLISGCASGESELSALTAVRLGVCVLSGVLGGVTGVNRRERLRIR